jgi:hypothetical protein
MDEQKAIIEWRDVLVGSREVPELEWLIWIPNGLPNVRMMSLIKRMGHKAGLPDFFLACPSEQLECGCMRYPGLWLELKRLRGGKISPDQRRVMTELDQMGYAVAVAYGRQAAKIVLLAYLGRGRNGRFIDLGDDNEGVYKRH